MSTKAQSLQSLQEEHSQLSKELDGSQKDQADLSEVQHSTSTHIFIFKPTTATCVYICFQLKNEQTKLKQQVKELKQR